jgi:hypothetical protein
MEDQQNQQTYIPLFIIIGLLFLITMVLTGKDLAENTYALTTSMGYFMAGFFLVFAGFKLVNLPGFAQGYSMYDLLARRWKGYGYVYPFLELFLGIAYLIAYTPAWIHLLTAVLMGVSGIGVTQKLLKKQRVVCACLGTVLRIPLTKITAIEDFGMMIMAIMMLLI